ncbi:PAS domain S-box protein [Antarcticibacterium flavum]|uniref:histidine kinase n=1 Tax=Antarcticibacterium flavum TaxID=2058175 RepID=A0A5B7X0R8_9FLAO|nr:MULTISPECIES: PAS domain S-box protein [Antarcticibacterium]MCM4159837.1 hypothetical protein [Antarcticibacterium sp. W02-3]QCY68840.1 PAS domain S-box protein [Antarcticibacterium flavum]
MVDYLQVFNSLPLPCLLLEPGRETFFIAGANLAFQNKTGISESDLSGRQVREIWAKESRDKNSYGYRLTSTLNKVIQTGRPSILEAGSSEILPDTETAMGKKNWQIENIPVTGEKDVVQYILQILHDTTSEVFRNKERTFNEEDLDYNLEQARYFINQNPDGLYSLDREGKFLSVNDGLVNMAEFSESELLEMTFLPFCAPHHREFVLDHFNRVIHGEHQQFEADFITRTGKQIVLEVTLAPMEIEGKLAGAYGIAKDISRQHRAEETVRHQKNELLQSEKKFKALVQEGSDLTAILDEEGNYKFVSASTKRILGISPVHFIGKNAFDFIHPEDQDRVQAKFSKMGDQKQMEIAPYRFRDGQNKWRWIRATVTNLLDEPAIQGFVANSSDVTESVVNADRLEQLYQRYRLAASATGDLIYDWDLEADKVKRYFDGRDKLFGYTEAQVDQKHFWKEHIHPEELEEIKNTLNSTLANPEAHTIKTRYRFRRANGTYAQIIDRGHIVRDEQGKALSIIGATNDVSELTEKQEALEISNKRFSYAMKATKEMIWDWDISNDMIKRSKAFKKAYSYQTREDTVYNSWYDKIHPKDRERVITSINYALDNTDIQKWRQEYRLITNPGEKSHVVDRGYILRDDKGKAIRMVGALLDVTESRRLMKNIKKQNKVLKEIAWEQAHIVRAPLVRLKGLMQLLDAECYELWTRDCLLEKMQETVEEMDDIIKGIIHKTEEIESEG